MKNAKWLRLSVCFAILALATVVVESAVIVSVPDLQQPPAGSLGNPTHNACAPVSATNISEYWDVIMGHPNAQGVNAGLPGSVVADYYYYFMDASNWGSPVRANGNPLPAAPGTYNIDILPGFMEFVRWDAAHPFTTPPPLLPPSKMGYDWFFTVDFQTGFQFHKAQVDSGHPDIVCFRYWNPTPTGVSINEPGLGLVNFFLWGPTITGSSPPNPVENWNLNPNQPENIGHAVTGVGYYQNFDPDGGGPLPQTNWIICHDNWPTTPTNVAIPWMNWTAIVGVNPGQVPESLYWKDYNGDQPGGYMPDFDQKQDFNGDAIVDVGYCGPVAIANSLWWFQGKYPGRTIVPPIFYPQNPLGFIQFLAMLMKTNHSGNPQFPANGTYVDSMQAGIDQYLQMMQINDLLYEHTIRRPTFDTIEAEIERCQDVTLLIGFWVIREVYATPPLYSVLWARTGGHYVTAAGVNSQDRLIGISDPYYDNFESGVCSGVLRGVNHVHPQGHNDGVSASHDIYHITTDVRSPAGLWELDHPFWHSYGLTYEFMGQNEDTLRMVAPWPWPDPPVVGAVYSEIEAAVIVSPRQAQCDYVPGDINGDGQVRGGDVTYGVRYFKGGPQPPDSCYHDSIPGSHWLYVAGDANGNCEFRGSDITYLVAYFKGQQPSIKWCRFFPPPGGPGGPSGLRPWEEATEPIRVIPTEPTR